jgi:biopolymer transport protein ExbD
MARKASQLPDKIHIDMTPMIDVVFQLISFFMFSLKVVSPEGDFDIRMPLGRAANAIMDDQQVPPIRVKLSANPDGTLSGISMNGNPMSDFNDLQKKVVSLVGAGRGPDSLADKTEVEMDCDYGLNYADVVRAITAVSGTVQDGQVVELIKKIKFAPPKAEK